MSRGLDALVLVSLALLGAAILGGFALQSAGDARLVLEVLVVGVLGGSILVSFVAAARAIASGGPRSTIGLGTAICVAGIGYVLFVFVPALMSSVTRDRAPSPDDPCRTLAPVVSWWLTEQTDFEAAAQGAEPDRARALAARRADELGAWLERLRRLELPLRLQDEASAADDAVVELLSIWQARRFDPSASSTTAISRQRNTALHRIRALGAACADD